MGKYVVEIVWDWGSKDNRIAFLDILLFLKSFVTIFKTSRGE